MRQPTGFEDPKYPNHVCKLKKTLYGLHQSGYEWVKVFKGTMLKLGFKVLNYAESAYIKRELDYWMIVVVYIDDCLCITKNDEARNRFFKDLSQEFDLKDLGEVQKFLGVKISRDEEGHYILSQQHYVENLLETYGMQECNTAPTPMDPGSTMALTESLGPLL